MVAVDTATTGVILTKSDQVASYERLYTRQRDAALSPGESLELLTEVATTLANEEQERVMRDEITR